MELPILITVLGASFAGSAHCGAMCGGFAAFSGGSGTGQLGYHLGRGLSYLGFGAIAGALGAGVESAGGLIGLGRAASLVAGGLMIAFGIHALLRARGVAVPNLHLRLPFSRALARLVASIDGAPRLARALTLGLATALMPCGWLYVFVLGAAGAHSALGGAALMGVFWLGTLPVLTGIAAIARSAWRPLEAHRPTLSALAIVFVGLASIFARAPQLAAPPTMEGPVCHGRSSADL